MTHTAAFELFYIAVGLSIFVQMTWPGTPKKTR